MAKSKIFFNVKSVEDALQDVFAHLNYTPNTESIPTTHALGRVLAVPPLSPTDLPTFDRSAMDGYAVRASDTFGASDALPSYLDIVGHINMGEIPDVQVDTGQAVLIHTGAMIPEGADAVVMVERTQHISDNEIEVLAPVANGENIIKLGEDVRKGSPVLSIGHSIRSQDIGGLLAVGITTVEVIKAPRVAILSGGDELVDAETTPKMGQIRDINSYMLHALCTEAGAEAHRLGIASDTFDDLFAMAQDGLNNADMLILSAGSSVSVRDLTEDVINQLGEPGVLQHGLAVKPGKPTLLAVCDGKPVIGLPGNPVSAMLVARQVILPILHHLQGKADRPTATIKAILTENIASTTGRTDSMPVRIVVKENMYHAEPIRGKSNLIYTLLKADGLVTIPLNIGGYKSGTEVDVILI